MIIKKCDIYKNSNGRFVLINKGSLSNFYNLTIFLLWLFGYIKRDGILKFIEKNKFGMLFEEVNLDFDNENSLVYVSESYHSHDPKHATEEIKALLEEENFIKLCQMGFLDYNVMTKENFIHLLFAWDAILDKLPSFALLYFDDNNWYDVLPFDSQEEMEQFIADHTKIENLEK